MTKEFRLFGPPGTGKTTRLANVSIPKAIEKYGSDAVCVTSFTRAAAMEIAGRGLAVNEKGVGTLHALCFRGLGYPELTVKHIDEWNAGFPGLQIYGVKVDSLDEGGIDIKSGQTGDKLLARLNIMRSKLVDPQLWGNELTSFAGKWSSFKNSINAMDFTDLIENAISEDLPIPNNAKMMFVDEAQDLTPLQLKLIRKWGLETDRYMLVGDDDQTIYTFTGASPNAFLTPAVPDKNKMILGQSYRVPRTVLERSMRLILQVTNREAKTYKPRDADGAVRSLSENFKNPEEIIRDIEVQLQKNNSCMVLASCAYMLKEIIGKLVDKRIPFGNKYRKSRGDWNPLAIGGIKRVSARDLLHNFLSTGIDGSFWNVPQFLKWAKDLSVSENGLKYGIGKKVLKKLQKKLDNNSEGLHSCRHVIDMALTENAKERAMNRDIDWFYNNVATKRQKSLTFPVAIYNKYKTIKVLEDEPPVTIGTIHSVKGGESGIVYLYPDISMEAEVERQKGIEAEDALRRLFYVGMTRAKKELVLMSPITNRTYGKRQSLFLEL